MPIPPQPEEREETTMSGMIVHGIPGSPYVRAALLTLEKKGADYELAAMQFGTLKQQPQPVATPVRPHSGLRA